MTISGNTDHDQIIKHYAVKTPNARFYYQTVVHVIRHQHLRLS